MRYVQVQFSLKFEPQVRIRRGVNQIKDALCEYYGPAQMTPIPDEFAPEAPRIILYSKNGHSQLCFSQISVDLTVNFDEAYWENFNLTKEYMMQRLNILPELLDKIHIQEFCFLGLSYNIHLNTENQTAVEYMIDLLKPEENKNEIYEASRRITLVQDNTFFINQQIGVFREYQGSNIPDLMNLQNAKMTTEGVNLVLDVNNRYGYQRSGALQKADMVHSLVVKIYELIECALSKWR